MDMQSQGTGGASGSFCLLHLSSFSSPGKERGPELEWSNQERMGQAGFILFVWRALNAYDKIVGSSSLVPYRTGPVSSTRPRPRRDEVARTVREFGTNPEIDRQTDMDPDTTVTCPGRGFPADDGDSNGHGPTGESSLFSLPGRTGSHGGGKRREERRDEARLEVDPERMYKLVIGLRGWLSLR